MDIRSFFGKGQAGTDSRATSGGQTSPEKSNSKRKPKSDNNPAKRERPITVDDSESDDDLKKPSGSKRKADLENGEKPTKKIKTADSKPKKLPEVNAPSQKKEPVQTKREGDTAGKPKSPSRKKVVKTERTAAKIREENASSKVNETVVSPKRRNVQDGEETKKEAELHDEEPITVENPKPKFKFNPHFKQNRAPLAIGTKEIPEPREGSLFGKVFLITGVLDSIERENAYELIKQCGGKVAKTVTKSLTHAVVGRDPGESKIKQLEERKIPQLSEDDFFNMIRDAPTRKMSEAEKMKAYGYNPAKIQTVVAAPVKSTETHINLAKSEKAPAHVPVARNDLFTDKYRPLKISDLIGNKTQIEKLSSWLSTWESKFGGPTPSGGKDDFRAVLISGSPGLGKTSSAHVVATELGFHPIEFNASDTRNKTSLQDHVAAMTGNRSMGEFFTSSPTKRAQKEKKTVLIMDEVDGMSGGDRGGVAELIKMIKKTKIPIICICNDKQSVKVRSLKNYCLDLSFRKITPQQAMARMLGIAQAENLKLNQVAMEKIAKAAHGDVRQMVNTLQLLKNRPDKHTSIDDHELSSRIDHGGKDVSVGLFDALPQVFTSEGYASRNMNEKMDAFFVDHELIPLFVQQNYAHCVPASANQFTGPRKEAYVIKQLSAAADSISDGEIIGSTIRKTQNWKLLPVQAVLSTVKPAYFMKGGLGQQAFPAFLGKLSTTNKTKRLVRELQEHIRIAVSVDNIGLLLDYIPVLSKALYQPLLESKMEGIDQVLNTMESYGLTKEDWEAIIDLSVFGPKDRHPLKQLDSKVKAAFTKRYNSSEHALKVAIISIGKEKSSNYLTLEEEEEAGYSEFADVANDEEEEEQAEEEASIKDFKNEKMIKAKKKKAASSTTSKRGSGKTSTTSKRGGKSSAKSKQ